jgi:predicted N-acyltransferase
MHEYAFKILDSLSAVPPEEWDRLAGGNPTIRHAFLQSLIDAGCTSASTGWLPQFLTLWRDVEGKSTLCGAVPLYMKGHSYGEYVFDWAWADAYERAGLNYYPKLLAASPFTPCSGARLLAETDADRRILIDTLLKIARDSEVSSLHVLFPTEAEQNLLTGAGLMPRSSVQFHWHNAGYGTFDDFLAAMSHDKRKRIRQERRKIADAGIGFMRKVGRDIRGEDWDFFTRCYELTYRAHHSTPYLNREFFGLLGERMPDNLLLVVAMRDGTPIASSLNLFNHETLFGRYWGTTGFQSGLHFETCYYQTLEFAIERGIRYFEGGAQGEHKLARGFLPVKCRSAHWLKHPEFSHAVEEFLRRESGGIDRYVGELADSSPFKAVSGN